MAFIVTEHGCASIGLLYARSSLTHSRKRILTALDLTARTRLLRRHDEPPLRSAQVPTLPRGIVRLTRLHRADIHRPWSVPTRLRSATPEHVARLDAAHGES